MFVSTPVTYVQVCFFSTASDSVTTVTRLSSLLDRCPGCPSYEGWRLYLPTLECTLQNLHSMLLLTLAGVNLVELTETDQIKVNLTDWGLAYGCHP
jgi:hypothetical protein